MRKFALFFGAFFALFLSVEAKETYEIRFVKIPIRMTTVEIIQWIGEVLPYARFISADKFQREVSDTERLEITADVYFVGTIKKNKMGREFVARWSKGSFQERKEMGMSLTPEFGWVVEEGPYPKGSAFAILVPNVEEI